MKEVWGTSWVVQSPRLWAPDAGGPDLVPSQGTRFHVPTTNSSDAATKDSTGQNKDGRPPCAAAKTQQGQNKQMVFKKRFGWARKNLCVGSISFSSYHVGQWPCLVPKPETWPAGACLCQLRPPSEVEARLSLPVQLVSLPEPGKTFAGKAQPLCSQMCPQWLPIPPAHKLLFSNTPETSSTASIRLTDVRRPSLSLLPLLRSWSDWLFYRQPGAGLDPPSASCITNPDSGSSLASSPEWPSGPQTTASHFMSSLLRVHRGQGALLSKDRSFEWR